MNTGITYPNTLIEAVRYFSDLDVCHQHMISVKWPDGKITCPKCGGSEIGDIKSRRMLQCKNKDCRKQFSTKVGTIFEDSPLGLDKWFVAVWCIVNAKNGISSCELARALGVTQKTAWFMLHRIRLSMRTESFGRMIGEVEGDETFVGGLESNKHKSKKLNRGRGTVGKAIVQGLIQRGGEAHCRVVPNQKRKTLQAIIREHVEPGETVYTDALESYKGISDEYVHGVIDHTVRYVDGRIHTNCMENFWSLLKRSLCGTYVAVDAQHLDRYLDEQTMRFNHRKSNDRQRFAATLRKTHGKRLTYAELIGE